MNSLLSDISAETNEDTTGPTLKRVPRLASLLHRLQHAKDADGQSIPLFDELLFFLDDPPPGTADRWQAGADLCQGHGIPTSRMSVWRFYRAHILPWRRRQIPSAPPSPSSPEETAQLQDQARHLAAQRAIETLNDPRLSPGHLIGLIQNDTHRQQIQLARDQFNDRLAVRRSLEQQRSLQRVDEQVRDELLLPAQMEFYRKLLAIHFGIPLHPTP